MDAPSAKAMQAPWIPSPTCSAWENVKVSHPSLSIPVPLPISGVRMSLNSILLFFFFSSKYTVFLNTPRKIHKDSATGLQ